MAAKESFDPQVIGTTIMGCVRDTFDKMCRIEFSSEPEFNERTLIEYRSKMRAFGLEKFNGPCYISVINYYLSPADLNKENAIGALVLYIEESSAAKLINELGYKGFDEDDEETLMDNCGEFCNVIAGEFKNELVQLGYVDLTMSAPSKYKNDVPGGVDFYYDETKLYEINFEFWKEKTLVIELTMGPVPRK